jgi:hypothetical protein
VALDGTWTWASHNLFEDESAAPAQLRFDSGCRARGKSGLLRTGISALALSRQPKAFSVVSGSGLIVPAL